MGKSTASPSTFSRNFAIEGKVKCGVSWRGMWVEDKVFLFLFCFKMKLFTLVSC